MDILEIKNWSDQELFQIVLAKAAEERKATAEMLKLLQEINRRRLYLFHGYTSLFTFCVEALGYSESSAQRRVASVRVFDQVPNLETKIIDGSLSLSKIAQAQSFFQAEAKNNHPLSAEEKREVLEKIEKSSAREAELQLIALSSCPEAITQKEKIRPVTETHFEVKFIANQELMDQLERVRALLSHKNGHMTLAELISEMARISIEKLEPRKPKHQKSEHRTSSESEESNSIENIASATDQVQGREYVQNRENIQAEGASHSHPVRNSVNSKSSESFRTQARDIKQTTEFSTADTEVNQPSTPTRYIRREIESQVFHRDQGSCAYIFPDTQRRCSSTWKIQYHHVIPFACGGEATVENLELRCRSHNLLHAFEDFGQAKMQEILERVG